MYNLNCSLTTRRIKNVYIICTYINFAFLLGRPIMRELTRWQIIQACGLGSGIDTVIVDNDGIKLKYNDESKSEDEDRLRNLQKVRVNNYLMSEKAGMPQETQQHLNHMTCHQELMVEIVFKENTHAEAD